MADTESSILSTALVILHDWIARYSLTSTVGGLRDLIERGSQPVRAAAVLDNLESDGALQFRGA